MPPLSLRSAFFSLVLFTVFLCFNSSTYVVLVEPPEPIVLRALRIGGWYESFLSKATAAAVSGGSRMVHSYSDLIGGFAARLSAAELKAVQGTEEFIAAIPNRILQPQTTHSPGFLGLNLAGGLWSNAPSGDGVIIGMVDTGADVGHPSFSGEGMPPPPDKWRESAKSTRPVATTSSSGGGRLGARDPHRQHGRGAPVMDVNVLGYGNGTAVGMAPRAHLALYKVCSASGCSIADIVKAMDTAVEDGVDILSISLGGALCLSTTTVSQWRRTGRPRGGARHLRRRQLRALPRISHQRGPWVTTVAASTMDRSLRTTVRLGEGRSSTANPLPAHRRPRRRASLGLLSGVDIKGKVVVCDRVGPIGRTAKALVVQEGGGVGMILANELPDDYSTVADVYSIPAANLAYYDASKVRAYADYSHNATVSFYVKGTLIGTSPSPAVASFSSRGPSHASPGILKPDITGPGVNIIAAWPFKVSTGAAASSSKFNFNVMSGTSMSTPHLTGIAALVRSAHPSWSPAAVKSAIMTTADAVDRSGEGIRDEKLQLASLFATGAGHVNPSRATDPGLVYDIQADDYIPYLCSLGYPDRKMGAIVGRRIRCSDWKHGGAANLNYPSFSVSLHSGNRTMMTWRTATNVEEPAGVAVAVSPETLRFSEVNEKVSFTVTFSSTGGAAGRFAEGHLMWVSRNAS
ncbi:unnamed protein product [Spirodela intermedia]|uniref:Uncharacterized protein n=1 Tax=Spirodela intermedia TaxID=51605 RepID=A0A7I8KPX6_SPIIN|nr:unnamed protein product [Spirodela intermedia]